MDTGLACRSAVTRQRYASLVVYSSSLGGCAFTLPVLRLGLGLLKLIGESDMVEVEAQCMYLCNHNIHCSACMASSTTGRTSIQVVSSVVLSSTSNGP